MDRLFSSIAMLGRLSGCTVVLVLHCLKLLEPVAVLLAELTSVALASEEVCDPPALVQVDPLPYASDSLCHSSHASLLVSCSWSSLPEPNHSL